MYVLSFLSMTNFVWALELTKGQTSKRITSNKSVDQIFFVLNYISETISQSGNPHSNHHEQKNTTIQSLSVMKNENENKNRVSSEQTSKKQSHLSYNTIGTHSTILRNEIKLFIKFVYYLIFSTSTISRDIFKIVKCCLNFALLKIERKKTQLFRHVKPFSFYIFLLFFKKSQPVFQSAPLKVILRVAERWLCKLRLVYFSDETQKGQLFLAKKKN